MHERYHEKVPKFLCNHPKGDVQHIMKRSYPENLKNLVQHCSKNLFEVKSLFSDEDYVIKKSTTK